MASSLQIRQVDVWAAPVQDQPGSAAAVLAALADAGASVECVIGRRQGGAGGVGVLFVSPITGKKVQAAAREARLAPAHDVATLRVEGPDEAGLGSKLCKAIADAKINLRGVSATTLNEQFVAYFGFDSAADAKRATAALKKVATKPAPRAKQGSIASTSPPTVPTPDV